jgi:GNAT superfamily N-acetyltransferase
MTTNSIRAAHSGEGHEAARLLSLTHRGALSQLSLWHSPFAANYAEDLIAKNSALPLTELYILEAENAIDGAIEARPNPDAVIVNNIYVDPFVRQQGAAVALVIAVTERCLDLNRAPAVAFDVTDGQPALQAWYRRLGGREQYRKAWWRLSLNDQRYLDAKSGRIAGVAEAGEKQGRYGFSQFEIETSSNIYSVGQLWHRWFRTSDPNAAADPEFMAALAQLDSQRELIVIAPEGHEGFHPSQKIATSIRLHSEPELFLRRLRAQLPQRRYACAV